MRRADCERWRRFTADEGAATIVAAVLSVALLGVAWLGYQLGGVVLSRHRAEGAADLAALAAASQVAQGANTACERAREVAREMRVQLADCRVSGPEARVRTTAEPPGVSLHGAPLPGVPLHWAVHGRARAGPVGAPTAGPMSPAAGCAPPEAGEPLVAVAGDPAGAVHRSHPRRAVSHLVKEHVLGGTGPRRPCSSSRSGGLAATTGTGGFRRFFLPPDAHRY